MKKYHVQTAKRSHRAVLRKMYRDRHIYFLLLPAIIATLVFAYGPMPGLIMAFEDYSIYDGLFGSKWVGFQNIVRIFTQAKFTTAIWNTLKVSVLNIILTFPAPIILALLMNELKSRWFKKTVQTVSYLPHFLSWMSVVGLIHILFSRDGIVNDVRMALGASERITYLSVQSLFIWFVLGTALWKEVGWGTVIHLANISSINQELYEAAEMDGAGHFKKAPEIRRSAPARPIPSNTGMEISVSTTSGIFFSAASKSACPLGNVPAMHISKSSQSMTLHSSSII